MNQHNKIFIMGSRTRCLVAQIVGPFARRVVYWLSHESPTPVRAGDRIGMMKFGSRQDIYLPAADVDVIARPGDRVRGGETIIVKIKSAENEQLQLSRRRDMPTYEYECERCGHRFEHKQTMTDLPLKKCPVCRGKVRRMISEGAALSSNGPAMAKWKKNSQACSLEQVGTTCCGREKRCG